MNYIPKQKSFKKEILAIRVTHSEKESFKKKCKKLKVPASEVMRVLMMQFVFDEAA